ncbi:MAG: carbohydrate ABC transporter permease [Actinobacteria bacterium]|nr:carbohydrate ABC transporter permease [Actinomycetota bacterium]
MSKRSSSRTGRAAGLRPATVLSYVLLIGGSFLMIIPFLWAVTSSLKTPEQLLIWPPQWIPKPVMWSNYADAWTLLPLARFLLNSAFLSIIVPLLQIATASLAAYAFARLRFRGRDALFLVYLGTLMIPGHVTLIPNFILVKNFGWINSYLALIIPPMFSGSTVFGTFLLRQYFLTIPYELEDAARIDGCSRWMTFWKIIVPNSKPALATLAIIAFKNEWNTFLWPLVSINDYMKMPIQVGLSYFRNAAETRWEVVLAGTTIALVPIIIVFLLGQRYFLKGMVQSGFGGK